jgi:hypothetical protein
MVDFLAGLEAVLNGFSPEEQALTRLAFHAILDGRPVHTDALPAALGLAADAVRAALGRLAERGTVAIDPATGAVVVARGLALAPTRHALAFEGRRLYALCAVDAVAIPLGLGLDARVDSRCRHCDAPVRVNVAGGVVGITPPGAVIWAVDRDPARSLREHT